MMTFAHDTASALNSTAALICTAEQPDTLATVADLRAFVEHWEYSGAFAGDEAELAEVRAVRDRLRQFWLRDDDGRAALVNEILTEGHAQPHLVTHDGWGWHLHLTRPEQPLAIRLAVEAAMAMADVIRAGASERLRVCAEPTCSGVLVDLSRNSSRRYCSRGCGNRAHVRAYRSRKQLDQPGAPSAAPPMHR